MPRARRPLAAALAAVGAELGWLAPGTVVLLGLSGGGDSCGLLALVRRARPDLDLRAVHVRHGLRDDRADAAAACAAAGALGVEVQVVRVTVVRAGEGSEAAARRERLAALAAAAASSGAAAVLLAHSADDQAETLLLRLARGTGPAGLAGMRPWTPMVTPRGAVLVGRPALGLRREELRAAARDAGLRWVEDPTNADPALRRSTARHVALPAVDALAPGGDAVPALARLARLAADDADALDGLADDAAGAALVRWGSVACLRLDALAERPAAVRSRLVRRLLVAARGRAAGLRARDVDDVLALRPGRMLPVPGGGVVTCGGGWLAAAPQVPDPLAPRALPAALPEIGAELVARGAPPEVLLRPPGATRVPVMVAQPGALVVRGPAPGDRLPGPGGGRIADVLADAGVPRLVRPLVPVVCGADGDPRWVPGLTSPREPAGHGPGPGPGRTLSLVAAGEVATAPVGSRS